MALLTVYLRREPTTDSTLIDAIAAGFVRPVVRYDVQVYHDRLGRKPFGRFMWDSPRKPRRNTKTVTLNCAKWAIVWIKEGK